MSYLLIKEALIPAKGNDVILASIIVHGEKIEAIVKDYKPYLTKVDQVINARGLIAVPGGIDIHAHIYDPQYTHHEDFKSGTLAALYGGVTTVFDMPLRVYVDNEEVLKDKIDEGLKNSYVNFGIHAGMVNEDNLNRMSKLKELGVHAFKIFTCKPFRPKTDEGIVKAMKYVHEIGGLPFIHAEDDALIDHLVNKFKSEGRSDPLAHHESRPAEAEAMAIKRVLRISEYFNIRVHIAHVSSSMGAQEIEDAKGRGVRVTAETCPQYLYFTKDDVRRWGNYLKMNPSLKSREDVNALWRYLASGVIDAVASDNAPAPRDQKEVDVWSAWGGIPNIEVMFPLVFTIGVKKLGILTIERYVDVTARNPARIMGIWPMKGDISPGFDADIALLDRDRCFKVTADKLHHKVDWSPFEGLELCGWPRYVLVNGKLLLSEGEVLEENRAPKYV